MVCRISVLALSVTLGSSLLQAQAQQPKPAARSTADPYANNADAGKTQFPLAAPAGKDSGAITIAPAGSVNQGTIDLAKWKYGSTFNPPPNSKIWNCLLYTSPSPRD